MCSAWISTRLLYIAQYWWSVKLTTLPLHASMGRERRSVREIHCIIQIFSPYSHTVECLECERAKLGNSAATTLKGRLKLPLLCRRNMESNAFPSSKWTSAQLFFLSKQARLKNLNYASDAISFMLVLVAVLRCSSKYYLYVLTQGSNTAFGKEATIALNKFNEGVAGAVAHGVLLVARYIDRIHFWKRSRQQGLHSTSDWVRWMKEIVQLKKKIFALITSIVFVMRRLDPDLTWDIAGLGIGVLAAPWLLDIYKIIIFNVKAMAACRQVKLILRKWFIVYLDFSVSQEQSQGTSESEEIRDFEIEADRHIWGIL